MAQYDVIVLQGRSCTDKYFPEVACALMSNTKARVLIYQNHSTAIWSPSRQKKEIEHVNAAIKSFGCEVEVIEAGELIFKHQQDTVKPSALTFDGHLTKTGYEIVAERIVQQDFKAEIAIYESIKRNYCNTEK